MPPNLDYQDVCAYLRSLNIHFCERWVTESIYKLRSKNPGLSTNEIRRGVYETWLSTNLRDIKVGSLPPNILSYEKITLSGTYAIQVESMVNSAQSAYSELHRIENPDRCENITDKSDEDAKSKRCLTFVLCDGVQVIEAMEYQFIPAIKLNDPGFLPGFKMIVQGPVVCRKGMLLLKQENVKVYGGKVDSLCETNNLVKLLRTKLGLSVNNNENNTQQTVGNCLNVHRKTQNVQSVEVVEQQVTDNNIPYGSMEVDELLSQNDDILLNLSFEPGFEDEYNQNNSKPDVEIEHCFQVPKKPRINSSHEILQEIDENVHLSNNLGSVYEKNPNMPASLGCFTNRKGKPVGTGLLNSGSTSNSNTNKITPKVSTSFNVNDNDNDIIFEDDIIFESQCLQRKPENKNPGQTVGKSQMKISSYLMSSEISNMPPVLASTSSNCSQEQTPKTVMTYPFVYLKQVTDISLAKPTKFTVKAIILTLKSKISIKNDEFSLKACISDGSSTILVNFSSETLEGILEYSPCEVTSMMSEKTRNSAVGERLKGIFFSAQQKLLSMNCLMEIQFFNNGAMPLVVGLEEIHSDHVNALKVRSC